MTNYTKSGVFICSKCSTPFKILTQIGVEIGLVVIYTLFLTTSILYNIEKSGPPMAIYFKIITSYL